MKRCALIVEGGTRALFRLWSSTRVISCRCCRAGPYSVPRRTQFYYTWVIPLFREALSLFARARFPGGHQRVSASRWTVRFESMPPATDVLLLLTIEELAVNELREPFHHWVRTIRLPICSGVLGKPLNRSSPQIFGKVRRFPTILSN
jgi:hypothetical protein